MNPIEIGRLMRASATGFVVGCRLSQLDAPSLGALVRVPLEPDYQIYGIITDIRVEDDGLVRQLVTTAELSPEVIADNRMNRNMPVEMSVLAVGYDRAGKVFHLLPPRPALSLDSIYLCSPEEFIRFTGENRFGYFRHILHAQDIAISEVLAAHLQQGVSFHGTAGVNTWLESAARELITLLRDDYPTLMMVMSALADLEMVPSGRSA